MAEPKDKTIRLRITGAEAAKLAREQRLRKLETEAATIRALLADGTGDRAWVDEARKPGYQRPKPN